MRKERIIVTAAGALMLLLTVSCGSKTTVTESTVDEDLAVINSAADLEGQKKLIISAYLT